MNSFRSATVLPLLCGVVAGGVLLPGSAAAQREIVQPLPPSEAEDLRRALERLAVDPQSVSALVDAGKAALALGDVDGAIGFFGRADVLDPGNSRVKLGLASALVTKVRPVEALRLFAEAERAGADVNAFAAKRGLAFDLVGDNASAQAQYRLALSRGEDPRVREQLAISQAIAGQQAEFEATLLPLLEAQDLNAFRTRAMGLAILERNGEAAELLKQVMPPELAQSFLPYLSQLAQLSSVEQAAAVHLGVFPAAGQQAAAAASVPAAGVVATTESPSATVSQRLTPAGPPLGAPAATHQPPPAEPVFVQRPVSQPVPVAPPRPDLSAVFAGLAPAATAAPAPGAVNIAGFEPRRDPRPAPPPPPAANAAAPAPAAKPAPPAHPARFWVQLAAGADREALAFDWRRLSRKAGETLAGQQPHVVQWGRTNRLLAGPYPTRKAADDVVKALREEGMDSLRYQSPEGQEIARLR